MRAVARRLDCEFSSLTFVLCWVCIYTVNALGELLAQWPDDAELHGEIKILRAPGRSRSSELQGRSRSSEP